MIMFFDRYTNMEVFTQDLPEQIDFGRYFAFDNNKDPLELTYSTYPTNKLIRQDLLLEKNKSIQNIFIDISIDIDKSGINDFSVIPLIRRIKNKLGLNEFENLLYDKVFHLEEIFRQPHYLLKREIERVPVARAKRVPSKSYQYLASHTEDWIHNSIVSFKPSRILNEELELNYDIYENQLTVALIERCLGYLDSRLKEIQNIEAFIEEYYKLFTNRKDEKGWYKKIERNLKVIGEVYCDDNYHGKDSDSLILSKTDDILNQIKKHLLLLKKNVLFDVVNRRVCRNITLQNTNVLVDHKHYRYVKSLWIELRKIKPEKSEKEKIQFEQNIIRGVTDYAIALLAYCLKEILGYKLSGKYYSLGAMHDLFPPIKLIKEKNGRILLEIGKQTLNFIVIANEPSKSDSLANIIAKQNAYILFYSEKASIHCKRLIYINPLDADSTERLSSLIRKYLLKAYLDDIKTEYEYKHILRDYVKHFNCDWLEFDNKKYKYYFVKYPKIINKEEIISKINDDLILKSSLSRADKDKIISTTKEVISGINDIAEKLKANYLFCFNCKKKIESHEVFNLNYIKCSDCKGLIDSSKADEVIFKIDESKATGLGKNDWGMDYLEFKLSEL